MSIGGFVRGEKNRRTFDFGPFMWYNSFTVEVVHIANGVKTPDRGQTI